MKKGYSGIRMLDSRGSDIARIWRIYSH